MGKGPIIGLCSILLVACVVAVAININIGKGDGKVTTSNKAVNSICQHTLHKDACIKSLADQEETNPKELVKAEFKAAIDSIREAIKNSEPLKEAQKDKSTSKAFEDCAEFLDTSIENLQRSLKKFEKLDASKINKFLLDMETWLSAALIWQETCIDQFDNTTGDAGEKMKENLNVSSELSSNVLAFVTHLNKVIDDIEIPGMKNRRLMEAAHVDEEPSWLDAGRRRLLQANPKPDAVVALDGSGNFKSINEAIKTIPKNNNRAFVILVKPGVYTEYVDIPKGTNGVVLVGSGIANTKITGSKSNAKGVKTFATATVAVNGNSFTAKDMTIENSAVPKDGQAVALRTSGDLTVLFNCQIDSYQDTLYVHANRQFFRDCTISGTVDFIFGDARVVLQNCRIVARKPGPGQANMMTAQGRKDPNENGAIILQNCYLTGEPALMSANPPIKTYLGRPWKAYSRTIIMQSFIDSIIAPEGWSPWTGDMYLDTLYYAEFGNRGPGSNTAQRVNWKGIKKISPQEAQSYTPGTFIEADPWVRITGLPYEPGMMTV